MELLFSIKTSSWIVGKAMMKLNPGALYENVKDGQVLKADRLIVRKDELNREIALVGVVRGVTQREEDGALVVELVDGPAGSSFSLSNQSWGDLKNWMKKYAKVVSETDDMIEVCDG